TTVIDAYLSPLLGRYLSRLGARCEEAGLPEPSIMQSSGGVARLGDAARGAAWSVLSGPAGGAVGAATLARLSDAPDALGFDMGGTSCDVCVISDGEVRRSAGREIGMRPIRLPMVDVHTVGAGGGSIGWRDEGGALRAGPRSAGADPGPACYGLGGEEPTVTDANLVLGYLPPGGSLAGGVELDVDAAERSIEGLAEELGMSATEAAAGIVRVANHEMIGALRVVTVERGIDPRGFALMAFGGAGGMHAAAIAAELEIGRILCPRAAGVLSALGLIAGEHRHDISRTVMLTGEQLTDAAVGRAVGELGRGAAEGLDDHRLEVTYEVRYEGQAFELDVEAAPDAGVERIGELFAVAHERRYGYRDDDSAIELVGIRVAAIEKGEAPEPTATGSEEPARRGSRRAFFSGEWTDAEVLSGEPAPGMSLSGPAVLELPETTLVVPPGATADVDERGTVELSLADGGGRDRA
ncbi:MAG TPA: hydantoinase/oxoprolinase family protein, partial [Solirubrobacterales bacterium]|nr:hydantoinase/oxoprolinase family protein [Solirubrobacterales bacterium]